MPPRPPTGQRLSRWLCSVSGRRSNRTWAAALPSWCTERPSACRASSSPRLPPRRRHLPHSPPVCTLQRTMVALRPTAPRTAPGAPSYVPRALEHASHVFVRHDAVKPPPPPLPIRWSLPRPGQNIKNCRRAPRRPPGRPLRGPGEAGPPGRHRTGSVPAYRYPPAAHSGRDRTLGAGPVRPAAARAC